MTQRILIEINGLRAIRAPGRFGCPRRQQLLYCSHHSSFEGVVQLASAWKKRPPSGGFFMPGRFVRALLWKARRLPSTSTDTTSTTQRPGGCIRGRQP